MKLSQGLTAVLSFLTALLGLYGTAVQFGDESSALYFVLVCAGTFGMLLTAANTTNRGARKIVWPIAVIAVTGLGLYSWHRGGPHALWEMVACDLKLSHCNRAKVARIGKQFVGLTVRGFNDAFSEEEIAPHTEFCRYNSNNDASEVALVELSRPGDQQHPVTFSYRLESGPGWLIVAHDPDVAPGASGTDADIGRLLLPSRIERTPMSLGVGAKMIVRICGEPRNTIRGPQVARTPFWAVVNLDNIDVVKTDSGGLK